MYVEFAEPLEVQRLGVRFINRIAMHELEDVDQYLEVPPKCPASLQLPFREFTYQNRLDVPGHPYNLNIIRTIQQPTPPQTDGCWLILDIDVFTTKKVDRDEAILNDYLTKMRWLKNKAFFTFLLPSAIDRFKVE